MGAKRRRWFGALITALVLTLIASPVAAEEKRPSKNKVAVVNGSVITQEDFDSEKNHVQQRHLRDGKQLSDSQIKKEALENLIASELLYQTSQKEGIKVDEAAVNEQLASLKKRFPGEAEFESWLNKMSLSEAAVKSQIKRGMAVQQFVNKEIIEKTTVSDKEIKAFYNNNPDYFKQPERVQASHILIKVETGADESQKAEARKKLENIQKKLKKDGDFAALAKEFSQCPSSARGGDLGYFTRGQMVKPFEEAAFGLKPGEVSDIVETRFGYHLIKAIDKKPETTTPYAGTKDRIGQYLKQKKAQGKVNLYVDKLKEKAKVEIFLTEGPQ